MPILPRGVTTALCLSFVLLWSLPGLGLFITSLRDSEQIVASGWWRSFSASTRTTLFRALPDREGTQAGGPYMQEGNLPGVGTGQVVAFGLTALRPDAFPAGATAPLPDGGTLSVDRDGHYRLIQRAAATSGAGVRIYTRASVPPAFTLQNYRKVLSAHGVGRAFVNSAVVAVPSTVMPAMIAVFAAYALAWMRLPGRHLVLAGIVGLMALPLQVTLIPLLSFHNAVGQAFGIDPRGFVGIWLAHTGFGLPFAIYLLRNAMAAVPRAMIEAARMEGATDLQVLWYVVLPLCLPALAGLAAFQFLWTWNDLLLALVFLGPADDSLVLTGRLINLMGTHGGDWDILSAAAFVSVSVPLLVFLCLQEYLKRGVLDGAG